MSTKQKSLFAAASVLIAVGLLGLGLMLFFGAPHGQAVRRPEAVPDGQPVEAVGELDVEPAGNGRLTGYVPNPKATRDFLTTLARPHLREAGPELFAVRDETPVLLYRALYEAHAATHGGEPWVVGKQGIGDCVSWGWAHGADIHLAVQLKLGQSSEWRPAATEAIYGGARVEGSGSTRGGYGDGSYGGAAARWTRDWGIVFRQPYPDLDVDLTKYSAKRAKDWGNFGCGGKDDQGRLDAVAKQHPIKSVALVRTFEEAAAAISNGYPVPVCSGQGFTEVRDKDGFCRASGRWSHCMCFIGVRYDRPGLLCLNSWGPRWVSGPKWPADQPDGSFWVDQRTAASMLRGQDSFALSGEVGFPPRDLRHGDWVLHDPAAVRDYTRRLARYRPHRLRPGEHVYTLAP